MRLQSGHISVHTHACSHTPPAQSRVQTFRTDLPAKKKKNGKVKISTLVLHCMWEKRVRVCCVKSDGESLEASRLCVTPHVLATAYRPGSVPPGFHPCSCCLLCRAQHPNPDSHLAVWTFSLRPLNLVTGLQGAVLS